MSPLYEVPRVSRRSSAFTLVECVAVLCMVALVMLVGCGMSQERSRELANRTVCASRLAGIYKTLNTYSVGNQNNFPTYTSTKTGAARGFRYTARNDMTYTPAVAAEVADSVTAPLWAIVRDGSTHPMIFECPSDSKVKEDRLLVGLGTTSATDVRQAWDFNLVSGMPSISFSVMDMYDNKSGRNWNPSMGADWVFMSDDNNSDGVRPDGGPAGALHVNSKVGPSPTADVVRAYENSAVHRFDGQNVMYGDGHVGFAREPFQGPGDDNVFARGSPVKIHPRAAPTLSHDDSEDATDVVLLPVTGNGGVNLVNSK